MDVGFCGLGIMGGRMAANLAAAGHELSVWTRTPGKAAAWAEERDGVTAVDALDQVAGDVVVSMVVDGPQVTAVADGLGDGEGRLLVDMSTIGPTAARRIAAAVAQRGWRFVDAPVTGSSPKAEDGTLTIIAGGATEDVDRARPLFDVMGALTVHAGEVGQGQMVKLVNNAVAAVNTSAVAQALIVGRATGCDLDALVEVIGAGSGQSAMLDLKAGPMRHHDYATLFKLEHMLKDVRLCLEEGQLAGVPFPFAADVREQLTAALGRGFGDADFAAVLESVEGLAGRRL